ncbi:MAG: hypothetical protein H0X63_06585 [Flavobacteriales bacterium]|jgi:hypothetical protein|nr:hypothetical protein [Flavobacteriales bacterium]
MDAGVALVYVCGIYSVGFAVFHIYFWKLFRWKKELQNLSPANRGILQIANLRLIYIFLFVASTCFLFPVELIETKLGNFFLVGNALFWLGRTIEQFIFLKINHKMVHVLTALFILGIALFTLPLFI